MKQREPVHPINKGAGIERNSQRKNNTLRRERSLKEIVTKKGSVYFQTNAASELQSVLLDQKPSLRVRLFCAHLPDTDIHVHHNTVGGYQLVPVGIIHPHSLFNLIWVCVTMLFTIICFFFIPYQVAVPDYELTLKGEADQIFWLVLMRIMDVTFLIDLGLQFRVAYFDDGDLVTDQRLIGKRYLRGWLVCDLAASVSTLIAEVTVPSVAMLRNLKILRVVQIMKLIKNGILSRQISDFLMVGKKTDGLEEEMLIALKMCRFAVWTLAIANFVACMFYAVGEAGCTFEATNSADADKPRLHVCIPVEEDKVPWMVQQWGDDFRNEKRSTVYIAALYWAFVTITTVGYGDISLTTRAERMYGICATFLGSAVFCFMVGEVTALASKRHASEMVYAQRMDAVEEFMRRHALPKRMRKAIRAQYEASWERCVVVNEAQILDELSYQLRKEVKLYSMKKVIVKVPLFDHASDDLVCAICYQLVPLTVVISEMIVVAGDAGEEMFIVNKGEVEVLDEHTHRPLVRLGEGAFFGEIALLLPWLKRTKSVRAVSSVVDLFVLGRAHLEAVVAQFPAFKETLTKMANARLQQEGTRQAAVQIPADGLGVGWSSARKLFHGSQYPKTKKAGASTEMAKFSLIDGALNTMKHGQKVRGADAFKRNQADHVSTSPKTASSRTLDGSGSFSTGDSGSQRGKAGNRGSYRDTGNSAAAAMAEPATGRGSHRTAGDKVGTSAGTSRRRGSYRETGNSVGIGNGGGIASAIAASAVTAGAIGSTKSSTTTSSSSHSSRTDSGLLNSGTNWPGLPVPRSMQKPRGITAHPDDLHTDFVSADATNAARTGSGIAVPGIRGNSSEPAGADEHGSINTRRISVTEEMLIQRRGQVRALQLESMMPIEEANSTDRRTSAEEVGIVVGGSGAPASPSAVPSSQEQVWALQSEMQQEVARSVAMAEGRLSDRIGDLEAMLARALKGTRNSRGGTNVLAVAES